MSAELTWLLAMIGEQSLVTIGNPKKDFAALRTAVNDTSRMPVFDGANADLVSPCQFAFANPRLRLRVERSGNGCITLV